VTSDEVLSYLEGALKGSARPATWRLLAESYRARGAVAAARAATEAALRAESSPLALNNLGVLEEEQGRASHARAYYTRAYYTGTEQLAGEGAAVARWNLARLDGDAGRLRAATRELAHRDRLRAGRPGPPRPLWASCPTADLLETQAASRSAAQAAVEAAIEILSARFGDLLGRTFTTAGVLG
jgi:hypothetical protein